MESRGEVSIDLLDEYLDAFYEDKIDIKVNAAKNILQLAIDFNNLEYLLEHGTFLLKSMIKKEFRVFLRNHLENLKR